MTYRVLLLILSGALIGGAFLVPVSHVENGGYTLEGWWLATVGMAVAIAGVATRTRWFAAGGLGALFLLGTASQLSLTQPHWLQYLEMRPARLASVVGTLSIVVLLVQVLVVASLLRHHGRVLWCGVRAFITTRRLLVAGVLFLFCAAHATLVFVRGADLRYVAFYIAQVVGIAGLFALNLSHLFLVVRAMPGDRLERAWSLIGTYISLPGVARPATRLDRLLPWLLAFFVFVVACFMTFVVLEATPHIQDEVAFLFQARYMAEGLLSAPPPPEPEAFRYYLLTVENGRWFSVLNPGWPAVLAVGVALGVPWLVNPFIAALTIVVAHALTRRLADLGTAHLLAVLLSASPWFLLLSGSIMSQTLVLFLGLAAFLLILKAAQRRTWPPALWGGVCLGLLFLTRPFDAVIVGAATGVWFVGLVGPRPRITAVLALLAGGLLTSVWLLAYNAHLTGDALVFPMNRYLDQTWHPGANRLGFGPDVGSVPQWVGLDPLPGHGLPDVLLNINQNLYNTNFELFGWPVGSLLLAAVYLLCSRWSRLDRGLVAFIALLIAAYSLYWFSGGPDYGARYWYLALYPLVWLTIRGASTCRDVLTQQFPEVAWAPRLAAAVTALILVALTTFIPWRMVAKYPDYRHAYSDFRVLLEADAFDRALVLVKTGSEVEFGPALVLNAPRLDGAGPVFARDLGIESNDRLREHFYDRPVYRVEGRFVAGGVTRIVSGPEPALRQH